MHAHNGTSKRYMAKYRDNRRKVSNNSTIDGMPENFTLDADSIARFQIAVYVYFRANGRRFPWRETSDPYRILVSEVMLQQTQTARVMEAYPRFLDRFPVIEALAAADAADVLREWQGLGYNRRALALLSTARLVTAHHGGALPGDRTSLERLPGIGPYTASAIRAFAFNEPDVLIETNIRTVFIHHFFKDEEHVHDKSLLPLVEATLDRTSPRCWYYALMDYGAMLKKSDNAARRSTGYTTQSRFTGSRREARGIILRAIVACGSASRAGLTGMVEHWDERFDSALDTLVRDGLLVRDRDRVRIVD